MTEICSRLIEHLAALRDGPQGPPSNPWFLAWILNAPKKQQDHHVSPSPTPLSSRDATRASLHHPCIGLSTCEGQVPDSSERSRALVKGTPGIKPGGSTILMQKGFEWEMPLREAGLTLAMASVLLYHRGCFCARWQGWRWRLWDVLTPLQWNLGWNPDYAWPWL